MALPFGMCIIIITSCDQSSEPRGIVLQLLHELCHMIILTDVLCCSMYHCYPRPFVRV